MKKIAIIFLIPLLVLTGLFFWKGGHHALALADALEEWLSEDAASQSVTIQYQEFSLNAESFWTEYADDRIWGLTAEGITAYCDQQNLYLDTGKAYALPEFPELKQSLRRLATGLLLHGRITQNSDTYHISMTTKELDLSISVNVEKAAPSITITASLPDGTSIHAAVTPKQTLPDKIPQQVRDAMVLARIQPPKSLTEPLEVLIPAAESLLPLNGDLKLRISCGILELSETVQLAVNDKTAVLTRKGDSMMFDLPNPFSDLPPAVLAAVLLRDGEFSKTDDGASLTIKLSAQTATELLDALVPQAADIGIALGDSLLCLSFTASQLTCTTLTAQGAVPFLFTTIPVDFTAELTIF